MSLQLFAGFLVATTAPLSARDSPTGAYANVAVSYNSAINTTINNVTIAQLEPALMVVCIRKLDRNEVESVA